MQQLLLRLRQLAHARGLVGHAFQVVRRFMRNDGPRNAAALTYTSLFAVVPLLTVVYSMLAALPAFRDVAGDLQGLLFEHLVPTTGLVIQDYMGNFAQQARQLTLIGVAVLIVTAGLMIVTIEKAFNAIWRVEKPRRGLQAFLIYWTVLTLGPLLLGAGILLSSYLASLPLLKQLTGGEKGTATLLRYLPFFLSALAFTLLYWAVPHCKVRFRDAATGGMVMALLFELAKKLFTWFVSHFPSYELVYGAFAAVPLFLMWVYVAWLLILFCAEWVAEQGLPKESRYMQQLPPGLQLLVVLRKLWLGHARGEGVPDSHFRNLLKDPDHSLLALDRIQWLQAQQLVIFDAEHQLWFPGRDYRRIDFATWLQALPWRLPPVAEWPQDLQDFVTLRTAQQKLELQERAVFEGVLSDYLGDSVTDAKTVEAVA